MANDSSRHSSVFRFFSEARLWDGQKRSRARIARRKWTLFAAAVLFAAAASLIPLALAQGNMPKIASVEPPTGKVGDTVTLTGENLEKSSVVGVFLSDDKNDYKAALVSQAADKLVIKVPQVKPGGYNVSV